MPSGVPGGSYALLLHLRILIESFFCEPEQDDCHVVHFRALPSFTAAFPPDIHQRTKHTDDVASTLTSSWHTSQLPAGKSIDLHSIITSTLP